MNFRTICMVCMLLIWCYKEQMKSKGQINATQWGLNNHFNSLRPRQMDAISQTTFSNAFFLLKMFVFRLKFHWSLFPRVQLTIFQQWFRLWLGAVQATSHYLNQWWLVYQRIYASLGLNELKQRKHYILHMKKMNVSLQLSEWNKGPQWVRFSLWIHISGQVSIMYV